MKNKILICFLSCVLIFTSVDFSFAHESDFVDSSSFESDFIDLSSFDSLSVSGVVISSALVGTLTTVAVASGIQLSSNEDIYNFTKMFYRRYADNWDMVKTVFNASVLVAGNKVVSVGKDFLNLCKDFFDYIVANKSLDNKLEVSEKYGIVAYPYRRDHLTSQFPDVKYAFWLNFFRYSTKIPASLFAGGRTFLYKGLRFELDDESGDWNYTYNVIHIATGSVIASFKLLSTMTTSDYYVALAFSTLEWKSLLIAVIESDYRLDDGAVWDYKYEHFLRLVNSPNLDNSVYDSTTINYKGNYSWGNNVGSNVKEDGSLDLFVPGNVGSLVGVGSTDVIYNPSKNPSYDLPIGGVITVPGVSNPSIDIENDVAIPNTGVVDTPNTGVLEGVLDWIISLVVPSSSYWNDTFNDLLNNIKSSFPMVDIGKFKELCISGTPMEDIYVNLMGVKKLRVFNASVVNGIVNFLRPIVSGFMALCLMLFNYKRIYKLIRNSDSFGSVAGKEVL